MPSPADYPRVELLFGPSPVHRLERLSEHLGGEVELWAKREDCNIAASLVPAATSVSSATCTSSGWLAGQRLSGSSPWPNPPSSFW